MLSARYTPAGGPPRASYLHVQSGDEHLQPHPRRSWPDHGERLPLQDVITP
jgi:hypothetical protein